MIVKRLIQGFIDSISVSGDIQELKSTWGSDSMLTKKFGSVLAAFMLSGMPASAALVTSSSPVDFRVDLSALGDGGVGHVSFGCNVPCSVSDWEYELNEDGENVRINTPPNGIGYKLGTSIGASDLGAGSSEGWQYSLRRGISFEITKNQISPPTLLSPTFVFLRVELTSQYYKEVNYFQVDHASLGYWHDWRDPGYGGAGYYEVSNVEGVMPSNLPLPGCGPSGGVPPKCNPPVVPLPATFPLLAAGLFCFGLMRRFARQSERARDV